MSGLPGEDIPLPASPTPSGASAESQSFEDTEEDTQDHQSTRGESPIPIGLPDLSIPPSIDQRNRRRSREEKVTPVEKTPPAPKETTSLQGTSKNEEPKEPKQIIKKMSERKMDESSGSTTLYLPAAAKLKGDENWSVWKPRIKDLAVANGLEKYISVRHIKSAPKFVDFEDEDASADDYDKYAAWKRGDSKMKMVILYNCDKSPAAIINNCETAMDMWTLLTSHYEGSGVVLNYNAIVDYNSIRYENFSSLEQFVIAFKLAIERLATLKLEPPKEWHPILFVNALSKAWPIWAERQRSAARSKTSEITLDLLIADITDEARTKEKGGPGGKGSGGNALYGNQPPPGQKKGQHNNKGKSGSNNKDKKKYNCKGCGKDGVFHAPEDCFVTHPEKRKAWEDKKKKDGTWKEGKSDNTKKSSNDDEDERFIMGANHSFQRRGNMLLTYISKGPAFSQAENFHNIEISADLDDESEPDYFDLNIKFDLDVRLEDDDEYEFVSPAAEQLGVALSASSSG